MLLFYCYDTPYLFYNLYKHGPHKPCCVCVNSEQRPCRWELVLQGIHISAKLYTHWRQIKHSRSVRQEEQFGEQRSSIYGEKVST